MNPLSTLKSLILSFTIILQVLSVSNKLPVIAILANPEPDNAIDITSSHINMQYVRWLEESRADIVVIQPWYNETQIEEILSKVNGVLWQGGIRDLVIDGQFESVARTILEKIIEKFENENIYIPLWGTCQGFELLHAILVNSVSILDSFNAYDYRAPLIFNQEKIRKTKMFADLDDRDINDIITKNVTSQYHHYGVSPQSYYVHKILKKFFRITSLAKDKDGKNYVASIEGRRYPIYAIQFHPEMVQFTKDDRKGVATISEAVKFSESLSSFFIKESVKNNNRMEDEDYKRFDYLSSYEKLPVYDDGYYYYYFHKEKN